MTELTPHDLWRGGLLRTRVRRRRFRRPRGIVAAGAFVALAWVVIAAFAPLIAPHNPLAQNWTPFLHPSRAHLFGTDELGRDVLSRVVFGARLSLPLALLLVSLSAAIGGAIGLISGYFRGWVDGTLMRLVDLFFAFPPIILAMVVTAALGPSIRNAVLALVVVSWPSYARVVRGLVLSIGNSDYVLSSRLIGRSARVALLRDVLPNVAGPVVVLATLDLGNAMLLLAGLSFLGLGAQPPVAEWGSMVANGAQNFEFWWLATFPGMAIFTSVLAFNFLGDGLRDALDPQAQAQVEGAKP